MALTVSFSFFQTLYTNKGRSIQMSVCSAALYLQKEPLRGSPSSVKISATYPRILDLPNEILEHIIDVASATEGLGQDTHFLGWTYPTYQHAQLKSLALTCRRLYALCVPFVWRDKEFILPREDDQRRSDRAGAQTATDILAKRPLFRNQEAKNFGYYVRTLCRDLTNGPHYDMRNSQLLAQLVCNLQALRIDFHSKARSEHYGLRFFIQHCPHLSELYLENCRDTFDDFHALVEFRRPLRSVTLICCTVRQRTLDQLIDLCKSTLRRLMLQRVLIEPDDDKQHRSSSLLLTRTTTAATLAVSQIMPIPLSTYTSIFRDQRLTQLALSDSVSYGLLYTIVQGSPHLTKLAIVLHETEPATVTRCLLLLATLKRLSILSLAFRQVHPLSTAYVRLPCAAPAAAWSHFARQPLPLRLVHVSASQLLMRPDTLSLLASRIPQIMLHPVAWVPPDPADGLDIHEAYRFNREHAEATLDAWSKEEDTWNTLKPHLMTFKQAQEKGFQCFDSSDTVCFIKGVPCD